MTSWPEGTLIGYDTETTGIDVDTARIVTASIVEVHNGQTVNSREWLLNPGVEIPAEATAIHGITTEHATEHGMKPGEALDEIALCLMDSWDRGHPVVMFNAPYDLTLLDREMRRHGFASTLQPGPVIDPFVIDKHVDRWRRGKRTLGACCEYYHVPLEQAHTSAADSLAAVHLAAAMATAYPDLAGMTLDELHAAQVSWRTEWAADFEVYLAKQGKRETISGAWPLIPHADAPAAAAVIPQQAKPVCGHLGSDKKRTCISRPGHAGRHTYDAPTPTAVPVGAGRIPQANRNTGFYTDPQTGQKLRSVTTILNQGVPKEALIFWAGNTVADCAMENLPMLVRSSRRPEAARETWDWLRRAHTRKKEERGDLGKAVHKIIEAHVLGKPLPAQLLDDPELAPYLQHFLTFVSDYGVTFKASEMVVAHHAEGYAGTLDYLLCSALIVDLLVGMLLLPPDADRGKPFMGDTKTGGELDRRLASGHMHGIYPEAGLQMSAYRACPTAWLRDGSKVPMPETHPVGLVLHLRPEGYRVYPALCDERVFAHFLDAQRVAEWTTDTSKSVIGPALAAPASLKVSA